MINDFSLYGINHRFKSGHQNRGRKHSHSINMPRGKDHWRWKGGVKIHVRGYRMLKRPGHPRADVNGWVFEHILVLEEKLGRPLLPNEHTHHINGNKQDNRPENLINLLDTEHFILHKKERLEGYHSFRKKYRSNIGKSTEKHGYSQRTL